MMGRKSKPKKRSKEFKFKRWNIKFEKQNGRIKEELIVKNGDTNCIKIRSQTM